MNPVSIAKSLVTIELLNVVEVLILRLSSKRAYVLGCAGRLKTLDQHSPSELKGHIIRTMNVPTQAKA